MERIQPRWRPWPTTSATKHYRGDGCRPLEYGSIKMPVSEGEERCTEFLGHVDTPTAASLWGVKHMVDRIIGALDRQKPVRIIGVLPTLHIFLVQHQRFPFAHASPGQTQEIDIVFRIIALRYDRDNSLFQMDDGPGRVAMVHLTWSLKPERDPFWPETVICASLSHWAKTVMIEDHGDLA